MQPMPTVEKAYSLIRKEEKQREGYVQQTSILAGLSAHSNSTRTTYHNNNRINMNFTQGESSNRNANQSDVTVRGSTFRKGVICGNCSKEGHLIPTTSTTQEKHLGSTLATLNGENLAISARMDQLQNQLNQMMLLMQQNSNDGTRLNTFKSAVDSRATDHIYITLTSMHNVRLCKYPIYITIPNGHRTQVRNIGSVYINPSITLHDDQHKRISHGTLCNGLYIIKQEKPTSQSLALSINNNKYQLWHARLRYPSFTVLEKIKSISLPSKCKIPSHSCSVCPLAKQHAFVFQSSDSYASNLFDLIHVDV
ncbi:cysteine-rich receptor-like protein kinase 8 [Tanacetum coccineum]